MGDGPMARVGPFEEHGSIQAARVCLAIVLEKTFGVGYRGEVVKRSFDGWRQIHLCNAAKGEILSPSRVRR